MEKSKATPAARRAANERHIDLNKIAGTGIGGYIQLSDVTGYREHKATPLAKAYAAYYGVNVAELAPAGGTIEKKDVLAYMNGIQADTIPVSGMRSVIAKRMQESMQNVPQYTNHSSINVYEFKKFLASYTERNMKINGVKPTISDLLIKAAAMALQDNMILNSSFCDSYITIHRDINIGLAVALEDGLVVPNIKNADKKPLPEITAERRRLVEKARAGRLLPDEYTGGTFTISNMGNYPVEYFTPIINLPESAILGVGAITDKVVPVDGNIGIRPVMGISLTSDHRHIDGAASGKFISRFKEIVENPASMETED